MDTASAMASATTPEAEIRSLINRWIEAARAGDVEAIMTLYTPDMVSFDAIGPLQLDAKAYREQWEMCLQHCDNMEFEIRDLHVTAGEDAGFSHHLVHCTATGKDGTRHVTWMRISAGYRRTEDGWRIAHDHCSVPFDPMSEKALMNLEP